MVRGPPSHREDSGGRAEDPRSAAKQRDRNLVERAVASPGDGVVATLEGLPRSREECMMVPGAIEVMFEAGGSFDASRSCSSWRGAVSVARYCQKVWIELPKESPRSEGDIGCT
jgi:hypothetical protein